MKRSSILKQSVQNQEKKKEKKTLQELDFRYHVARNFKCEKCDSPQAKTELLSLMGEKKKKLSKFNVFDMILTSCKSCGHLQFFDKYFLPEENIWDKKD